MSRKDDEIHIKLGHEHACQGLPRYKYQDSRLQSLYDRGYNSFGLEEMKTTMYRSCQNCGRAYMQAQQNRYCSRCI